MPLVENPPTDLDIIQVAEKICVELKCDMEWEKFGMKLLGTTDNHELILRIEGNSLKEKCRDLLSLWKKTTSNPKWEQVIQALREVNLLRLATELETALVAVQPVEEQGEVCINFRKMFLGFDLTEQGVALQCTVYSNLQLWSKSKFSIK